MYNYICKYLKKHGFNHYEISNFAKKGYESKHNLTYWNNLKYYGFGLGASGYIDNIRYTNTKNINKYLNGNYTSEEEIVTKKTDASNYAILGLRTIYGVNKKEFKENIGKDFNKVFDTNDLEENEESFYLSKDKWYIENSILTKFI